MIEIRRIDEAHQADIRLPNEPFSLWGRMILTYQDEKWGYTTVEYPKEAITEMCFPDENYDYGEMEKNTVFLGAYDGETCVGLAILQDAFFKYLYLYDLKVNSSYRGRGVGTMLMEKAKDIALERGYRGIYTIGQDNNLSACLFYVRTGFDIGGLDTRVYGGTSQEGKADIYFYLDCKGEES